MTAATAEDIWRDPCPECQKEELAFQSRIGNQVTLKCWSCGHEEIIQEPPPGDIPPLLGGEAEGQQALFG